MRIIVIIKLNIIIGIVIILFNFILKVINLNKDVFLICFTYIFIKILLNLAKKKITYVYYLGFLQIFSPKPWRVVYTKGIV